MEHRTSSLPFCRWRPGPTALLLCLLLARTAAAAEAGGEASPAFPDEARKAAQERVAVALRLEIEEQGAAAALAFQQAVNTEPRLVAVQRAAGNHAAWLGQWEAAAAAYGAITRLDPYSAEGYALLGQVRTLQGDATGIDQLHKALEMDEHGAAARLPLARLARAAGDLARLGQILDGIAPEDRELPAVVLERATLALLQGDTAKAKDLLDKSVAAHPDDPTLPLAVAELWLGHGRCQQALPLLRQEAAARPRAESLRSLGWGLLACGREPLRAAGAFSAALQRDGSDDGARIGLAWALLALEQPGEPLELAGRWLDEVLQRTPTQGGALLARAELLRRKGEQQEAAAVLDRIPAGDPAADEADNQRGRLAIEREDPYAAVTLLRKLAERRPDLLHARINLIEAYVRAGRSGEARDVVHSVAAVLPEGHPLRAYAEHLLGNARSQQ